MWFNPSVLTSSEGLDATQILFAMYQLQVAFFSLIAATVIFFAFWKFLCWFFPSYWYRTKKDKK